MNLWKSLFLGLALFALGYGAKGLGEAKSRRDTFDGLTAQLLQYSADSVAATRTEAERILAAVAERNPRREQQAALVAQIIEEVRNAPSTTDCVNSPAIRVALGRLRDLEAVGPGRVAP